jgi:nucleotide-binding universal stress UspA family protein
LHVHCCRKLPAAEAGAEAEASMKILIPVDGSKFSKAAVEFVASRSTLIGKNPAVELLNVQAPVPARAAGVVGKSVVKSYHEDEAARALKSSTATLARAGMAAMSGYVVGHAPEEIARRADKDNVDLIVMGSHGHGALAQLVLGSVTHAVLAHTKKPVLVVRNRAAPRGDSLRAGIAVDGSKFGRAAVKYALKHRDLFGAKPTFILIHVVPDFAGAVMPDMAGLALPAYTPDEIQAMQRQSFETAVAPLRKLFEQAGVTFEETCLVGAPGEEIAAFAKKRKLDVLVLGSHGHGAFKAAVLGSVATRVAHICTTPLLLVREA